MSILIPKKGKIGFWLNLLFYRFLIIIAVAMTIARIITIAVTAKYVIRSAVVAKLETWVVAVIVGIGVAGAGPTVTDVAAPELP